MKKIVYSLAFALLGCALFWSCIGENEQEVGTVELVSGDLLPEFSVIMNDGRVVTTECLRGKKSLVVFFHTGCPDCRAELPEIQRVYNTNSEVDIVCISRKEGTASIEEYWNSANLTLPYSAQENADVYHLFAKSRIPRVYVVDEELVIHQVFTDSPLATYEDIMEEIGKLK